MEKRRAIAIGMAAGVVWGLGLLVGAALFVRLPVFTLVPTVLAAFLAPGLVMMAMAGRRFFLDAIDGGRATRGAVETDDRVLADTTRQLVLALAVWPAAAVLLGAEGPGVIVVLGLGFAVARVAFWVGSHRALALQVFGVAASFVPTVLVALWALLRALT